MLEQKTPILWQKTVIEDGTLYKQTREEVEKVYEQNRKLRDAEAVRRGDRAAFQPLGTEHAYVLQVPQGVWNRWIHQNPEEYQRLMRGTQSERIKAASDLQRRYPHWFVQAPRRQFNGR